MNSSTKAIVLGGLVYFLTRDAMATLAAGGGSLVLDRVSF